MTGLFEEDDLYKTLLHAGKSVMLIDSYLSDYSRMANVGLQDFEGAYIATEYLINNGHRRIAFAGPPIRKGGVVDKRLSGYKSALEACGLPFDAELLFEREFSTSGTMQLGGLLAKRSDITALFATADIMAAGIMSGIQQSGKRVPEDFSIVGFDDINWCRMTMPMLTSVHQDANKKGEIAADHMMKLLELKPLPERNVILPVRLVERQSVKKL